MSETYDPSCPALRHNTYAAAVKGPRAQRCICPPALAMFQRETEMAAARRARRKRPSKIAQPTVSRLIARLPGNGPWRILPECPALTHNTEQAATCGPRDKRCICPRALDKAKERRERQAKLARQRGYVDPMRAILPPGQRSGTTPLYLANTAGAMPSMPDAACKTPDGARWSDRAIEGSEKAIAAMKVMCSSCRALELCRSSVLKLELFPGSWGGVYGGMSVQDRRRVSEIRRERHVAAA